MQKAEACSPAATQTAAAPPQEANSQAADGKSLITEIAREASRHDITFSHVIDIRLADMRGDKALRPVPMLPGLDLKNGKTNSR